MNFKIIVHSEPDSGFWAEVPSIPGCASQGDTMEELLDNIREAIEGCLEADAEIVHSDAEIIAVAI